MRDFGPDRPPFAPTAPRRARGAARLFRQVADDLTAQLAQGVFAPGDQLPAEPALADAYGVNRLTVREAIAVLVRQGLLRRVHGVGSFVAEPPSCHRIATLDLDLSYSLRDAGEIVVHDVLGIAAEDEPAVPGGAFPDFPGPVARLRIRRRVGERPWSQTLAWLPASLLYPDPSLRPEASLADVLLERHGLRVAATARSLAAEPADEIDAEHLDVAAGAPLLVLRGGNADQHGRRIGEVAERIRGDRVELALG